MVAPYPRAPLPSIDPGRAGGRAMHCAVVRFVRSSDAHGRGSTVSEAIGWAIAALADGGAEGATMTIEWTAPAGGFWELETLHVRGGQPRIFQDRAPRAFRDGFAGAAARYGLPIDHLDVRFVNDHCYARMRPVGAPEPRPGKPSTPPPDLVLKLLARLHPELRRRTKAARRAIEQRLWHEDRRRWEEHDRPEMLATGRALQAEPLEQLDDDVLVDHLRRTADHFERGIAMHLGLIPVHNLPVGRLVQACRSWGIDDADTFALLGGNSPASTASAAGLAAIAAACAAAGVVPTSLDDVRAAGPDARSALDSYLADHAWSAVTQYSPRGLTLIEQPDLLVQAISAATVPTPVPGPDVEAVRDRVPLADRPRFDDLLDDARRCYGIRDDNVALTFMWPAGLVRRALLECGRRLAARGLLADEAHVFALDEDEIAECPWPATPPCPRSPAPGPRVSKRPMPTAHPCTSETTRATTRPRAVPGSRCRAARSDPPRVRTRGRPPRRAGPAGQARHRGGLVRRRHRDRHRVVHRPSMRRRRRRGRARPAAGGRRPRHHTDDPGLRSGHADRLGGGDRGRRPHEPHRHLLPRVRHPRGGPGRRRHHPHPGRRARDRRPVDRPTVEHARQASPRATVSTPPPGEVVRRLVRHQRWR